MLCVLFVVLWFFSVAGVFCVPGVCLEEHGWRSVYGLCTAFVFLALVRVSGTACLRSVLAREGSCKLSGFCICMVVSYASYCFHLS